MKASDAEIREVLEPALGSIRQLDRRPYGYASSYPLEAIDVVCGDNSVVPVLFKDLSAQALSPAGKVAKPAFLLDARREIDVYRKLLARRNLGTANCYAAINDSAVGRHWLFLERLDARELYQDGEFDHWLGAARWLSRLHAGGPADNCHLIQYDAKYFRRWPELADFELPGYEELIRRMADIPSTVIHGEFYASNVLIQDTTNGVRVCPVDWETTGNGAGLIDLAALTSGRWSDAERAAMVGEYHTALAAEGGLPPPLEKLFMQLDWFRLHLAVRWRHRPFGWKPPAHQEFDWAAEAQELAAKLGLGKIKWRHTALRAH
jgi:hypothetical protein